VFDPYGVTKNTWGAVVGACVSTAKAGEDTKPWLDSMTTGCLRRVSLLADSQAEGVGVAVGRADVEHAVHHRRRGVGVVMAQMVAPQYCPGARPQRRHDAVLAWKRADVDHAVRYGRGGDDVDHLGVHPELFPVRGP